MKKFLIAVVAVLLLLSVLFFAAKNCRPPRNENIRHGTVVIISTDNDSITLAADSRETEISFGRHRVTFTDTSQKIFRIGSIFFAIAGFSEVSNIPTRTFVTRIYDTTRSIRENMPVIEAKLKKALQTELDSYSKKQKRYLAGRDYTIILYITGYENGVPVLCEIKAGAKFVTLFANPVQTFASTGTGQMFGIAGIDDHIREVGFNQQGNKLRTMTELISLEARHHPDVDSLVQYVIIKKDGYRTGSNFTPPSNH